VVLQRLPCASAVGILAQPTGKALTQVPVETPACGTPAVSRGAGIDLASGRQPFGRGTITL
jgi:hypothetical protein